MLFQTFKLFKPFNLLLHPPPRDAGEEQRWGLERSVAVELSEAIERIERFFLRNSDAEKNRSLD
jgi:hypothetical protein